MKCQNLCFNLIMWLLFIALGSSGYSQIPLYNLEAAPIPGKGAVDWDGGFLYAAGAGVPPQNVQAAQGRRLAVRAATVDAQRQLLEMVQGVHVTATTTVENLAAKDIIVTKLEGFLRGAQPMQIKYFRDRSVEVTMRIPLDGMGGVADVILENAPIEIQGEEVFDTQKIDYEYYKEPPKPPAPMIIEVVDKAEGELIDQIHALQMRVLALEAIVSELLQEVEPKKSESNILKIDEQPASITGVILDARHRGVRPAAFPHIYSRNGKLIYGFSKEDGKLVCGNERVDSEPGPLAGWTKDVEKAKLHDRAKLYPAVLEVAGKSKDSPSIIVISNEDAQKIIKFNQEANLLLNHRVVIVY